METKFANAKDKTVKFWNDKKGTIAVATTATTIGLVALMRMQRKTVNQFMDENDLTEQWNLWLYNPEEDVEP